MKVKKYFFNISINILIKFLTLRAFEIFYFTPGKLGRYHLAEIPPSVKSTLWQICHRYMRK